MLADKYLYCNFNDYSNICYGTNANKVYANKSYYMVFLRNLCWNL